ncbi:MAG: Transcription elongation factor [Myxococcales bacterium]|nr:Transcription elongation factor [Myxococcales bacterium]
MVTVTKAALKAELVALLAAALETARRAHAAALEGATHAEAKPENNKDTRGLEQSYLARGQAQRVAELEAGLADVSALALRTFGPQDPIAMSAFVTAEEDDQRLRLFIAPHGGGSVLASSVQVVTPASPLGHALLGKRVDDDVEVRLPGRTRTLVIIAIE